MGTLTPIWTTALSPAEHDLILFGLVAAALGLLATLVRVRFTSAESQGVFRVASLTANAVVALALVSYVTLVAAFLLGYAEHAGVYRPTGMARLAWELRYMDWVVTVPLLVLELVAVSSLPDRRVAVVKWVGTTAAVLMVVAGFLGAFILDGGTNRTGYVLFGLGGSVCFAVLYALFLSTLTRSLPRLPDAARRPYRASVVVLLLTWLIYPVVYGFSGVLTGGAIAVVAQLLLCAADMIAKIGFGTLIHQTAVLRSRNDEDLDPSTARRPRSPRGESVYVTDARLIEFDDD